MNISKTIARSLRRIAEAFDPTGTDAEGATYEVSPISGYCYLGREDLNSPGIPKAAQVFAEADLWKALKASTAIEVTQDYEPVAAGRDYVKASVFVARRKNLPGNSKNKPEK